MEYAMKCLSHNPGGFLLASQLTATPANGFGAVVKPAEALERSVKNTYEKKSC